MEEELISFKTAKLAKEKRFNIPVYSIYSGGLLFKNVSVLPESWNKSVDETCSAPTQSLLQKWLRDLHGVDIHITRNKPSYREYRVEIYKVDNTPNYIHFQINTEKSNGCKWFDEYEEALEEAIFEALKLI